MKRFTAVAMLLFLALLSFHCGTSVRSTDADLTARAQQFAQTNLIVDTHIDLPMRLMHRWEDITVRTGGDMDYVRAREGGLDVPFMSIYVPAEDETAGRAVATADSLISLVNRMAATWPEKMAVARSTRDVRENVRRGLMSLVMGMENGAPIAGRLEHVKRYHDLGIRYITLCHGTDNHISDSSYDTTHTWKGLSPFGEKVVREMNRVGIMIDVSHISDDAFYDVMRITVDPVIASHSSCRAFTPGFERNASDEMIRLIGKNGGLVMINFGSEFLTETFQKWEDARMQAVSDFVKANNVSRRDSSVRRFNLAWRTAHPVPYATIGDVADHIDHVVRLIGVDHVGFGSDFEGVGDMLPVGLKDVSGYPNLVAELFKRGYSDEDVRKICGENLMRVWREVEESAR